MGEVLKVTLPVWVAFLAMVEGLVCFLPGEEILSLGIEIGSEMAAVEPMDRTWGIWW
jgi:hypothetical protein